MSTIGHFLYFAFDPWNFVTNISAEIIQVGIILGVWKAAKRWLVPRIHSVVHKLLAPHLEAHLEAIKAHISSEIAKIS